MANVSKEYFNIDVQRRRIYDRGVSFQNFENIDEETIKRLMELKKKNGHDKMPRPCGVTTKEFEQYNIIIKYLGSNNIHLKIPTFDEQILYLILTVDPDLKILDIYQSGKLQIKNPDLRRKEMDKVKNEIRRELGLFDIDLLNYEIIFQSNYLYKDKLLPKYNKEYKTFFLNLLEDVNLSSITAEQIENVKRCIDYFEISNGNKKDLDTLAYNIDKDRFNLKSLEEKALLFVMIADPECTLYKIYNQESKLENIMFRALLEYGYYNKTLVKLEESYIYAFNLDVDTWTI